MMKWMQRGPFRPITTKECFTKADAIDVPEAGSTFPETAASNVI
jgi:hypothetical protein